MPNYSDDQYIAEDKVLIEQLVAHSLQPPERKRVFDVLYIRHRERLLKYCRNLTHNSDLANDIAQEAFLELWRLEEELKNPGGLQKWLQTVSERAWSGLRVPRIAVQTTQAEPVPGPRTHHKRRVPEIPASHEPKVYDAAEPVGEEDQTVQSLHDEKLIAMMHSYATALPDRLKPFYELRMREGLEIEELDQRLGITKEKRRRYMYEFKKEFVLLLVTNRLAAEEVAREEEVAGEEYSGCKVLRGELEEKWPYPDETQSDHGVLSRKLVLWVARHCGFVLKVAKGGGVVLKARQRGCKNCFNAAKDHMHNWHCLLPAFLLLRKAFSDRSELTACELPKGGRMKRRLTVGLVAVLACLVGGVEDVDTIVTDRHVPIAVPSNRQRGSAPSAGRGASSDAQSTHSRTSSRSPDVDGGKGVAGKLKSSPRYRATGRRNDHTAPGEASSRLSAPSPGPTSTYVPMTPHPHSTSPTTMPHPSSTSPHTGPVAQRLVVHFTDSSVSEPGIGVRVAVNGVTLGTCFKTDSAPASGCTYTVHVGDIVRLTQFHSLVTWNKPCDGDSDFPCEFLVDGDITTWIAIDGVLG